LTNDDAAMGIEQLVHEEHALGRPGPPPRVTQSFQTAALERVGEVAHSMISAPSWADPGHVNCRCDRDRLNDLVALRDDLRTSCKFFTFLMVFERGDADYPLELLVRVYSPDHRFHVTVRTSLRENSWVPSIARILAGAVLEEREASARWGLRFIPETGSLEALEAMVDRRLEESRPGEIWNE
jgi:NADH:ubiquinone oxidoreductase subunit C